MVSFAFITRFSKLPRELIGYKDHLSKILRLSQNPLLTELKKKRFSKETISRIIYTLRVRNRKFRRPDTNRKLGLVDLSQIWNSFEGNLSDLIGVVSKTKTVCPLFLGEEICQLMVRIRRCCRAGDVSQTTEKTGSGVGRRQIRPLPVPKLCLELTFH